MFQALRTNVSRFLGEACIFVTHITFSIVEFFWGALSGQHVKCIATDELQQLLSNDPSSIILVDVRSDAERQISMLPNAISLDEFLSSEVTPPHSSSAPQRLIVPYCTIGGRSYWITRKLLRKGRAVRNYRAGVIGWTRANLPLVTPQGLPTRRLHRYWAWFSIPKSYEAIP